MHRPYESRTFDYLVLNAHLTRSRLHEKRRGSFARLMQPFNSRSAGGNGRFARSGSSPVVVHCCGWLSAGWRPVTSLPGAFSKSAGDIENNETGEKPDGNDHPAQRFGQLAALELVKIYRDTPDSTGPKK
jgi:hypothetical protein